MATYDDSSCKNRDEDHRISAQEEAKYLQMFQKLGAEDGYLDGKRAVILLGKSGLPPKTLAKVWALADTDIDGRLSVKVVEMCK